jgi:heterodisulfide reductase subunit C
VRAEKVNGNEIGEKNSKELPFEVDRRSVYKCVQCGTCRSVCPVFEVVGWESANTRGRMLIIKSLLEGRPPSEDVLPSLASCTTCGICAAKCPAGANPPEVVEAARAQLVKCGVTTEAQEKLKTAVTTSGNSFGETKSRLHWLSDTERSKLPEKSDYVYFVGCFDSYRYPEFAKRPLRFCSISESPSCRTSSAVLLLSSVLVSGKMQKRLWNITLSGFGKWELTLSSQAVPAVTQPSKTTIPTSSGLSVSQNSLPSTGRAKPETP